MIWNLLSNALKFSRPGRPRSVVQLARTRPGACRDRRRRPGHRAGVPAPRSSTASRRAMPRSNRQRGGLGLGLADRQASGRGARRRRLGRQRGRRPGCDLRGVACRSTASGRWTAGTLQAGESGPRKGASPEARELALASTLLVVDDDPEICATLRADSPRPRRPGARGP